MYTPISTTALIQLLYHLSNRYFVIKFEFPYLSYKYKIIFKFPLYFKINSFFGIERFSQPNA